MEQEKKASECVLERMKEGTLKAVSGEWMKLLLVYGMGRLLGSPAQVGLLGNADVFEGVIEEVLRQEEKWGVQDHDPYRWLSVLMEEVGEVGKELNDAFHRPLDYGKLEEELVQVMAVCFSMIESLRRGRVDE